MGKIARGLLLIGAVALAAFLIFRALRPPEERRAFLTEPVIELAEPITFQPEPVTIQPVTEPVTIQPITFGLDGVIAQSPIPTTSEPAPLTTQTVTPAGGEVTVTQFAEVEPLEQPLVLPTFEPTITTVGTGFTARPIFGL